MGFKEVHWNSGAKRLFELYVQEVTSTLVYNDLRKWRAKWIQVTKFRYLSDA